MRCPKCGGDKWTTWGREKKLRCVECQRRRSRARRAADPAIQLWNSTRRRARENGTPHTLTLAEVRQILAPWSCEYCTTPVGSFPSKARPNSATLDRLIPDDGYTAANTVLACHRCNSVKAEHTPETLRRWADMLDAIIHRKNLKA